MGAAVATIFLAALLLTGGLSFVSAYVNSTGRLSDSLKATHETRLARSITNIELSSPTTQAGRTQVKLTVRNTGNTVLGDFSKWDVVIRYTRNTDTKETFLWLPYTVTNPPGNNQWTVVAIYRDAGAATPEVFQKGLLDPSEELVILAQLNPSIKANTTVLVAVSTPNGVSATIQFTS